MAEKKLQIAKSIKKSDENVTLNEIYDKLSPKCSRYKQI